MWTACKVVRGTVRPGGSCSTPVMCEPPEGAGTTACVQGRCREIRMLSEGEGCPYPLGDVPLCDVGLYCTASQQGETGRCEVATAEGAGCDPVMLNQACGLGSYCDLELGVCRTATNFGGPSCSQGTECVSFLCDGVTGSCSEPIPTPGTLCGAS